MLQNTRLLFEKMQLWFMAMACSINLVFGMFFLASSLGIPYYHFYALQTVNIVIFSPFIDWLVWLTSAVLVAAELILRVLQGYREERVPLWTIVPGVLLLASFAIFPFSSQVGAIASALLGFAVVGLLVFHGEGSLFASQRDALALVLAGSGAILIAIEVASLGSWLINPFDYQFPFDNTPRWVFPTADLNIFSVLYPLVPLLLLAFLFCWLWMPLRDRLLARLGRWGAALAAEMPPAREVGWRLQVAVLSLSAALAGYVAYYPYIRLSAEYLVGRDGVNYYNFLVKMTDAWSFTTVAPDRPLFMLLLYSIKAVTQQPAEIVIRFMPVACAFFLVLAVFWLVKTGTKDTKLALLSSILTAFSFNVTAGMMGYFLANWSAMVGIMLFFTLLLKAMEERLLLYSSLAGLVSIVVLGLHPYSWLLMAAVLAFYIVVTVLVRRRIDRGVLIPAMPLAITAATAVPLILFTHLGAIGLSMVMAPVKSLWQAMIASLSLSKLALLPTSLSHMADFWVGGAFGSPLIYLLGILGMATMADLKRDFNRIVFCWVLVPFLIIFAIVPGMEPYYYRIAYVIPFQILVAIGASWLLLWVGRMLGPAEPKPAKITHARLLQIMLLSLLALLLFSYALRIVDQVVVLAI
jgi:hypothetical protein